MKPSSLLPGAFHTIMVQSQAINESKKTGLCGRGKRLFTLLLISIKEIFWSLKQPKGQFDLPQTHLFSDSCKFLFCRFTSLKSSIFNWTVTFIYWNAILNSWRPNKCHPGYRGYFKNHKRADWARSRQRWQSEFNASFENESWSEILTLTKSISLNARGKFAHFHFLPGFQVGPTELNKINSERPWQLFQM